MQIIQESNQFAFTGTQCDVNGWTVTLTTAPAEITAHAIMQIHIKLKTIFKLIKPRQAKNTDAYTSHVYPCMYSVPRVLTAVCVCACFSSKHLTPENENVLA